MNIKDSLRMLASESQQGDSTDFWTRRKPSVQEGGSITSSQVSWRSTLLDLEREKVKDLTLALHQKDLELSHLRTKSTVLLDEFKLPQPKSAQDRRTTLKSLKAQNERLEKQVARLQEELRQRPPRSALEEAKGKILSLENLINKRGSESPLLKQPKQFKKAKAQLLTQFNASSLEEVLSKAGSLTREHQEFKTWAKKMQKLMTKLVPGQKPSLGQVHKWVHKLTEEYLLTKRLNDQMQTDHKFLSKLMKKFNVHSHTELWAAVCKHFT